AHHRPRRGRRRGGGRLPGQLVLRLHRHGGRGLRVGRRLDVHPGRAVGAAVDRPLGPHGHRRLRRRDPDPERRAALPPGAPAGRYIFRLDAVAGYAKGLDLPRMEPHTVMLWGLLILVGAVILAVRVTNSKAGRAMLVLHQDETVAASWGIAPNHYKLLAFGL